MSLIKVSDTEITVTDDAGNILSVATDSAHFQPAFNAAMTNDWEEYNRLALLSEPTPEPDEPESMDSHLGCIMIEANSPEEAREKFDAMMGNPIEQIDEIISNTFPDRDDDTCPDCEEMTDHCICDDVNELFEQDCIDSMSDRMGLSDNEFEDEPVNEELNEHDLRNWNGSPIYYLTKEQAVEQVNGSMGFWAYHDFGIAAKPGRRYATVPNGFGPTAPEGYEWACVPKED